MGDDAEDDIQFFEEADQYRFEVSNTSQTRAGVPAFPMRRVWVDRRNFFVNRLDYLSSTGEPTITIQAEDFRPVNDDSLVEAETFMLPFRLHAVDRQKNGEVSLHFQELVANRSLVQRQGQ